MSKSVTDKNSVKRGYNPRWLYLFLVIAVLSGIVSTTTRFGDHSLQQTVERIEKSRLAWNSWRELEDSIRLELDQIGFNLAADSITGASSSKNTQGLQRIKHHIAALQIFKIPDLNSKESEPIFLSLARLSLAADTLIAAVSNLSTLRSGTVTADVSQPLEDAIRRQIATVHALNSLRKARVPIMDRNNLELNVKYDEWNNRDVIFDTTALFMLVILVALGVVIAIRYSRSARQSAIQYERLSESEGRFRSVVANVPGVIFRSRIGKDWPIEFISHNIEKLTGYPASDFIDNRVRRFGSLIHPGDADRMMKAVSKSIEFGTPYSLEYRLINSSGNVLWVVEHGQAVAGPDGKPQWLDGAILDITSQKKATDDLAESEETLRALIDASPGFALLLDSDGRILAANESMGSHVGKERASLIGKIAYEIASADRVRLGWQHFRQVIDEGKPLDYVSEFEGKFTHIYFRPICDARGRVIRVAIFGQDITGWKRALNESERFKHILDRTTDIVGIINKSHELIYMNRANREFMRIDDSQPLPRLDFSKVYTRESLKLIEGEAMPAVLRDGIWQGEADMVAPNGQVVPSSIVLMAHRTNSSDLEFMSCIIRDMTERKRFEEALARSEQQLRQMTAGLPGVLYQYRIRDDGTAEFPYVSDAAQAIFDVDAEAIVKDSSNIFRIVHPDDVKAIAESTIRTPRPDSVWQQEFRCLIRGEWRWIKGSALPREQADGSFVWNGMLMDITQQKVAEEQLRQSEERFRKIFDAAGFGIASTTLEGVITDSNHAFQEMLQYSGEELRGMNFAAITHPEDLKVELALLASEAKTLEYGSVHYEKRYYRKDGEIIWARLSVIEFRGEKEQAGYYIGMAEDVTERKQAEEKIRESEMLYRALFENSGEGLFLMTDKFIDCNQRAAEIWKCERSEIWGKSPAEFSPEFQPDGRRSVDAAAKYIEDAMAGVSKSFNWRHLRSDGAEIDTEVSLKSLTISGVKMILATVRDVSERLRIEKELRESLIQLHTLVESAVDGIVIFTQDGSIESVNPAAERIFETAAINLAGTNVIDLVAEPHRSRYQGLLIHPDSVHSSSLLRGVQEVLGLRRGGIVFPMDLAVSPLELGSDLKFVAIVRDISERRSAEQQIIENEARLEAILSSAGDGIIVIDSDRVIQVANNAAQEIFGFAANELVSRQAGIIIQGIDEKPLPVQGERSVFDSMGLHRTRGEFPLQVSINRVSIGDAESFAVIARDMTEEYSRRERLIEADKLTSIGTLAAGIAHEFKNCLAGIIGNASFALDGLDEPDGIKDAREAFEQIIAIGEKADNIALSLLTYSRRREDDLELLDLRELIRSTLQFTSKEFVDKSINVVTNFADIPKVMVSVNRAQQVFLNLIINASQAIPDAGTITISVRRVDADLVVSISDTGVGISSENLRRIFDPFFSTKGVWGKDAVHGTGLGLTICRNIINSFGGEISVESAVGKGSTFTISLPIPADELSNNNPVRSENIKSLVLFSADPNIESAYSAASQDSGLSYRLARSEDYAEGSTSINGETLVVIDCASPYLSQLVQLIDSCQSRSIRMVFINKAQSSKELLQFTDNESPTFEYVPEFSELISGAVSVKT